MTLFPMGNLIVTPGAEEAFERTGASSELAARLLARHLRGDWGNVDAHDRKVNDQAVRKGNRVLSAYDLPGGTRIWIITEADRSATTILVPDEY